MTYGFPELKCSAIEDRVDIAALRDAGFGQRGRLLRGAKAGRKRCHLSNLLLKLGTNMNSIIQHHGEKETTS